MYILYIFSDHIFSPDKSRQNPNFWPVHPPYMPYFPHVFPRKKTPRPPPLFLPTAPYMSRHAAAASRDTSASIMAHCLQTCHFRNCCTQEDDLLNGIGIYIYKLSLWILWLHSGGCSRSKRLQCFTGAQELLDSRSTRY